MAGLEKFVLDLLKDKLIEVSGKKIIKGKIPFESDYPQIIEYTDKKGKKSKKLRTMNIIFIRSMTILLSL